ncbi:MAG: glycosyltransferase family 2 protein [Armatimonadetes bacterium]|nr:glycosyltransferase family 2 protein [Armatimonadota bacterium]
MNTLSIVVLNFRTPEESVKALESAALAAGDIDFELIAVDNASGDGSPDVIRRLCPTAKVIELPSNLGFAAGMNAGIREASGDYILLLNSDVLAQKNSIASMIDFMQSNIDVGICAPLLENPDGSESRTLLMEPTIARVLIPWVGKMGYKSWRKQLGSVPIDVEATEGAAVMVNRDILGRVGLLDEDFFFYNEIVEWCMRMRETGYRVLILPEAKMTHWCGGSSGGVRKAARIELKRSEYQLLEKRLGGIVASSVKVRDVVSEALSLGFYGIACVLSGGRLKRSKDKLIVHYGVLRWICAGMPDRHEAIYIRLFGRWD